VVLVCVLASISSATGGADGSDPITVGRGPGRYHGRADLDATPVTLAAQEAVPLPGRTPAAPAGELGVGAGQVAAGTSGPTSSVGLGGAGWRDDLPEITALIRATFGEHGEEALRVVYGPTPNCPTGESNGDPNATNGVSWGLFAIHAETWADFMNARGFDFWRDWSSAEKNTEMAYIIYERAGGFWPWSCWR